MPMGLSWSPRIAQSAGWTLILEACFRAKLLQPEMFASQHNPPAFVDRDGIFLVLWYDNLLATFRSAVDRDKFLEQLRIVCGPTNKGYDCKFKHCDAWNLNRVGVNSSKKPKYLGLEFCIVDKKRDRNGEEQGRISWRHDTTRLERWMDLKDTATLNTPRSVARAVGVILWNATTQLIPYCEESRTIEVLKSAGSIARANSKEGWDSAWTPDAPDSVFLAKKIFGIVTDNRWCTINEHRPFCRIHAASDASDSGYGAVVWKEGKPTVLLEDIWRKKMESAHIYLKEFFAATRTIEEICKETSNVRIMLCIDNTAVASGIRTMYAGNHDASEFLQRIRRALDASKNIVDVVSVQSEDNAADAPSRGLPLDEACCLRAVECIQDQLLGGGKASKRCVPRPPFQDGLRHEFFIDLDGTIDDNVEVEQDPQGDSIA